MTVTSWTEPKASDPRVANPLNLLSRILGSWLIGFSILGIGISVGAYRKGGKVGLVPTLGTAPHICAHIRRLLYRGQSARQPFASRTVLSSRAFRPFNASASPAYPELLTQIGTWTRIEKKTSAS